MVSPCSVSRKSPFRAPRRKRIEESMGGTRSSADGPTATVEETDAGAGFPTDGGERFLGPVQHPKTGENTAVLVAVAVTDHHLLHRRCQTVSALLVGKAPSCDWMIEKR